MPTFRLRNGTGEIRLRYLSEDTDRHGNVRLYVRRPGRAKVRLHEKPGTDAFMVEYLRALEMNATPKRKQRAGEVKGTVMNDGTLLWLTQQWFVSGEFRLLAPETQKQRRSMLGRLCSRKDGKGQPIGAKPFAMLDPRHVRKLRDEIAETPAAANNMVKCLRQLFTWAIAARLCDRNPAKDLPSLKLDNPDGHHSWTAADIAAFENRHPVGTTARLAMALLLYTGQRRSDVVLMGWQHVRDGWLTLTQQKNKGRRPVTLSIPVLPQLLAIIEATPSAQEHATFLTTGAGQPYGVAGFGNRFREWCDQAGLPHCSAHGLRKAMAAALAESGAGENEIMAWTGHRTSAEVTRYTRAARQPILAQRAAERLLQSEPNSPQMSHQSAENQSGGAKNKKSR